jgi:hypothetical protein
MALNITAGSATPIAAAADGILVQVNKDLTGNIIAATAAATFATITNPHAGDSYRYGGLRAGGAITVTPSTTCDISVTVLGPGQV